MKSKERGNEMKEVLPPKPIGSYPIEDCIFLLKNVNGQAEEMDVKAREYHIQNGGHYSEVLPIEHMPTEAYKGLYHKILEDMAEEIANYVGVVAEMIYQRKKEDLVLVSLARAGTPIGVLIKRYLKEKYHKDFPHYSISIIRDKGIDENALLYILNHHKAEGIQFVDGWTGKGVICKTLEASCKTLERKSHIHIDSELAVLCDPGECTSIYGTRKDILVPSACLNATISGLVSRTFLREDIIGPNDFHGAKYYEEWKEIDESNNFIEYIAQYFKDLHITEADLKEKKPGQFNAAQSVENIRLAFGIDSINRVKPGIGETTRVLLRRAPWKILVKDLKNPDLKHIFLLAQDKCVEVVEYQEMCYACCGLIKSLK